MLSFSLYSEWYRVVTYQSVDKKLQNLAVSYLGTDCSLSFVMKMKFSFLDPDFFSVIIHHFAQFTQQLRLSRSDYWRRSCVRSRSAN